MISFILNMPYTLIGLIAAILSIPTSIKLHKNPYAFIINVKTFKWRFFIKRVPRAFTTGHTIVLGPRIEEHDLEHELIHVRQAEKYPIISQFFTITNLSNKVIA